MNIYESQSNTCSDEDREQLTAYMDGELSPAEKASLEQRLQQEPSLQQELEELQAATSLLHALPMLEVPRSFTIDVPILPKKRFWQAGWFRLVGGTVAALFIVIMVSVVYGGGGIQSQIASSPADTTNMSDPQKAEPMAQSAAMAETSADAAETSQQLDVVAMASTDEPTPVAPMEAEEVGIQPYRTATSETFGQHPGTPSWLDNADDPKIYATEVPSVKPRSLVTRPSKEAAEMDSTANIADESTQPMPLATSLPAAPFDAPSESFVLETKETVDDTSHESEEVLTLAEEDAEAEVVAADEFDADDGDAAPRTSAAGAGENSISRESSHQMQETETSHQRETASRQVDNNASIPILLGAVLVLVAVIIGVGVLFARRRRTM